MILYLLKSVLLLILSAGYNFLLGLFSEKVVSYYYNDKMSIMAIKKL